MLIEFDPAKDVANRQKHGVSLAAAEEFDDPLILPARTAPGEIRHKMIDETSHGLLCAIVTARPPRVRVISLRPANRRERKLYAEQVRNS